MKIHVTFKTLPHHSHTCE